MYKQRVGIGTNKSLDEWFNEQMNQWLFRLHAVKSYPPAKIHSFDFAFAVPLARTISTQHKIWWVFFFLQDKTPGFSILPTILQKMFKVKRKQNLLAYLV